MQVPQVLVAVTACGLFAALGEDAPAAASAEDEAAAQTAEEEAAAAQAAKDADAAAGAGEGMYWKYESWIKNMDAELNSAVGAVGDGRRFFRAEETAEGGGRGRRRGRAGRGRGRGSRLQQ